MNKIEVVQNVLQLIEINEIEKANELIRLKSNEINQTHIRGIRKEISEIIKLMGVIDKEMIRFNLKKTYLERICPENTMSILNGYIQSLYDERADLVEQKQDLVKLNSRR